MTDTGFPGIEHEDLMKLYSMDRALITVIAGIGLCMAAPDTTQSSKNLVEQATRRMDGAIASIRKTGNVRAAVSELLAAEAEFRKALGDR